MSLHTAVKRFDRLNPIGNYYSSRGDHPKAITYFKRSLMLNREYLPAWTLMGHEYVELKNSHAAIEAYRKAVGKTLPIAV